MGVISLDLQQTDAGANKWSYNWLTDLPSINGVTVQGDLTSEELGIIIPTKVSELENDAGYVTSEVLENYYTKDETYSKDEVDNLIGAIVIPTKVSELENDAGYITDAALTPYYTSAQVDSLVEAEAAQRLNADTALSNRLTTAETNITANATAISNEATARQNADSDLSTRISTNASAIATNAANIATNTADIATNASNIATNTANIATNTTNIAANTSAITQNTSDIATNTANIATNASAIAQNASDIAANAANIATNTANIATNTADIATNASDIAGETDAREIADQNLQEQIDAIAASSDVVDIVGTYAALQSYDTTKLHDNDIIKVLDDETRNDATTYYRWSTTTSTWSYIGAEGPFYTKADADATFVPQTRTINSKALSSNITLTAQDVGALPDSTVIPTVNNATLTIQKNGTTVQTFTANSSSNKTANITVPTKTSDLTNDGDGTSDFATETYVDTYGGKIDVIKVNGTAQTITNKTVDLTVPTKTSDLTNDSNFAVDANYVHTDNNFTTTLKNKLDGIASGAEVNQNAFSNVKVGSTTVSADSKTDTLELVAGSNVTITPDATNDKVTIAATDTKYNDMTGATSSAAGSHGLVPAPAAGDNTKFLSGDGTWKTVSQYELPIASANTLGGVKIGENLSITNTGVLSADAQHIDVDSAMSTTSENPVQNKVITEALAGKTNTKRSYTTATTLNYKKITVVGGTYSTDGSGIILFTREERYIIDGMCASGYGGKCIELGTNHNASNTSATTSNRWVNIKVYGVPESRTTEIYCRMSPYTYVDVHSSGTITITDINESTWTAATNNATYIPLLGTDTALSTTSVAPVQNKVVTTALNSKADTSSLAAVATSGSYNDLSNKPTIPTVNNATLTIQKNGSTVKTFTANASTNVTANITVPTKTSDITNDSNFVASGDLAAVATSGSYNDLSNKPTIPTVNNATLTIQKNGSTVKTFTANASSNVTANITVPTATSELTNDAGFIDEIPVASAGTLGGVKVGSNLSINASGVLSADCPVYTANNVAPTADTTAAWKTALGGKGVYFTWYNATGKFTKQPSQYGFLMTIIGGSDVRQEWWTQTGGWHGVRTGNASGWSSFGGTEGNFISMGAKVDSSLSTSSANPVQNQVVTTKINELDRYYRSLVPVGTAITAEGTDLNTITYLKVGKYYCSADRTVQTFVNCPTSNAFMMEVFSPLSTTIDNESTSQWVYRVRILTTYMGKMYIQRASSGSTAGNFTYGAWEEFAYSSGIGNATLTIQKNGTNVQTFSANATSNATANITVPTKVSDLTNTSGGFITYCTCTSAATATTKAATVDSGDSNWVLRKGTIVGVKYTNTNTASATKLNVGGTGDKSVYYNTAVYTGTSTIVWGNANRFVFYMYDGTNWVWISDGRHDGNDNTYTTAYCSTAAGTAAKAATMTGYVLTANRYTVITFTNANTAASALTLNINGKGAKPLYINGAASSSTNYTLPAGSYIIWYNGINYYIDTSGNIPRTVHPVDVSTVTDPTATVTNGMIADGTLTYAKTATGEFLKLQLSTVDIGEGASLAPNTLYGVYE